MFKQGKRVLAISLAGLLALQSGVPVNAAELAPVAQEASADVVVEDDVVTAADVTDGEDAVTEADESKEKDSEEKDSEEKDSKQKSEESKEVVAADADAQANASEEVDEADAPALVSEADNGAKETVIKDEAGDYVFAASDLKVNANWGATQKEEDGKYLVEFKGKYPQIFYALPEDLDPRRIEKISVDTTAEKFSVKLCAGDTDKTQLGVVYGNTVITTDKLDSEKKLSDAKLLCFMGLFDSEDGEMTKEIGNITFSLIAASDVKEEEATPEEKPSEEKPARGEVTPVSVNKETGEYVYNVKDLTVLNKWGTEQTVNEDGSVAISYGKQYDQIFYELPNGIDAERIESVVVNVDNKDKFAIKLCSKNDSYKQAAVAYDSDTLVINDGAYEIDAADVEVLDLMNTLDGERTAKLSTVTFKMAKKTYKAGTYTFKASDLEIYSLYETEVETLEDGSINASYGGQYRQVYFKIPEGIDPTKISSFKFDTPTTDCAVKIMGTNADSTIAKVAYGTNGTTLGGDEDNLKDAAVFSVMNMRDGEAQRNIKSVTIVIVDRVIKNDEEGYGDLTAQCIKSVENNNPLVTQRYSADPGVMVYDGTVYIYSTNDIYEYKSGNIAENGYSKITTINCFASKDLVNWTDYGAIPVAGKQNPEGAAKWANNSWAPCAAHKTINGKEKFFLYFADNGSGIGVLTSDSPTGPWVDPIGKQLISRQTPNCNNVEWLFDPAVFVDDDGTGYLVFGGGVPNGKAADPGTARVVRLGDDMISLDCDPVQINPPYLFEDSGLNKIGDKYVYSYCTNFNCANGYESGTINYMVADDPMGPYTYVGQIFKNPASFFNDNNGNNHHSLFEFNGKTYIAYHARAIEKAVLKKGLGYRSTQINEVSVVDGKLQAVTGTMTGVSQVGTLNPYETQRATTIFRQKGIEVFGSGDTVLTVTNGDFAGVKGVNFDAGVSKISMTVKADNDMTIDIRIGNETEKKIGTINVTATNGEYKTFTADVENVSGTMSLYFNFNGDALVRDWVATAANRFTFDKLTEVENYNLTYTVDENGAIKISYAKQYGEIRFAMPEGLDLTKLSKIIVNVSAGDGKKLAIKALPKFGGQVDNLAVAYNASEVSTKGVETKSDIKYFGIMSMSTEALDVTIDSVLFEMEAEKTEEANPLKIEKDVPDLWKAVTTDLGDSTFLMGGEITGGDIYDENTMALVAKHYNAITFGNEFKPDSFLKKTSEPVYDEINGVKIQVPSISFTNADRIIEVIYKLNQENPDNQIKIRGHVLTWHSQTPEWFFHEGYDTKNPDVDKDTMSLRHEWYIKQILTHYVGPDSKYKDMFYGWDVVNEAVSDNTGTYRNASENSYWWKVYGSNEFITNAFVFANKYAPKELSLFYNDYNEHSKTKMQGILALLNAVKNTEGARIDGMGMQGHYHISGGATKEEFLAAARAYGQVVDQVQLTELDFQCSSTYDGTKKTYADEMAKTAQRYLGLYEAIKELRAEGINFNGLTVWGVIDGASWLQTFNGAGGGADGNKRHEPLFFDDNYKVKQCFWALVDPSRLEPGIKNVDIIQKTGDSFDDVLTVSAGDAKAKVSAVWEADVIKFYVNVEDATEDANDSVVAYFSANNEIKQVKVTRANAQKTATGYEAIVNYEGKFEANQQIKLDFVLTNGDVKQSFNDTKNTQDTSDKYFAVATLKSVATINNGTIKVDGELDEAWSNAPELPLAINSGAKAKATAKILWDEENLYVYAVVEDSVLNADASAAHEKDSIEVFIDENNAKAGSYDEDDKQYRINYLNEHTFNGTKCLEENVTSEVKITETGYIVEAAFKWTDIKPANGTKIGVELQINDADNSGKRIGTLNWYDTTGTAYSKPSVMATAVLVGGKSAEDNKPADDDKPTVPEQKPVENQPASQQPSASTPSVNAETVQTTASVNVSPATMIAADVDTDKINGFDAITVKMNYDMILRMKTFETYHKSNVLALMNIGNGVGISLFTNQVAGSSDLDLSGKKTELVGFADGFTTYKFVFNKKATLSFNVGFNMHVGNEFIGHTAYLYVYNTVTGALEQKKSMKVIENGNVGLFTNELTEVWVLIAK